MKKITVRILMTTAAFVVLFLSAGAAFAQKTDCSKTTDAAIVASIKQQFEADTELKTQMRHLNVSVKKRRVSLEGWADGKVLIDKAVATVKKTSCVKKVTSQLRENGGGSCGAGLRPCGDTCIDRRTICTIEN